MSVRSVTTAREVDSWIDLDIKLCAVHTEEPDEALNQIPQTLSPVLVQDHFSPQIPPLTITEKAVQEGPPIESTPLPPLRPPTPVAHMRKSSDELKPEEPPPVTIPPPLEVNRFTRSREDAGVAKLYEKKPVSLWKRFCHWLCCRRKND